MKLKSIKNGRIQVEVRDQKVLDNIVKNIEAHKPKYISGFFIESALLRGPYGVPDPKPRDMVMQLYGCLEYFAKQKEKLDLDLLPHIPIFRRIARELYDELDACVNTSSPIFDSIIEKTDGLEVEYNVRKLIPHYYDEE